MVIVKANYVKHWLDNILSSPIIKTYSMRVLFRGGKMSVSQHFREALGRNIINSNHVMKWITCNFSNMVRPLLSEIVSLF